ncbi:hypothetical protein PVN64_003991 [Klebsiella aerogenes]|uniref:hypothetical protein n=2 Tax=Klebsiella aerogenes TaxID=548 RepID=UPI0005F02F67|nr:hypothetical protein [Klebsiella aerogenes]EKM7811511.1 hypothetical protein [Klebsiella aerogenes]KJO58205.1 hypothetical protein SR89_12805 [Klebsiella aerogenes]
MSSLFSNSENKLLNYDFSRWMGNTSGSDFDFRALGSALDCTRDFNQVGIIFNDGRMSYLVRASRCYANPSRNQITHVIVTKLNRRDTYSSEQSIKKSISEPSLSSEISSTALSCGGALLTAGVFIIGTGATAVTAGASSAFAILGYAGAVATTAQCINGVIRLWDIEFNNSALTGWLDSEDWYTSTSTALDVISLASAAGALLDVLKTYKSMKAISSLEAKKWLKAWPRQDRARLTELIIKTQNPGISNKEIKALIRAGVYPKRYPIEPVQKELKKQLISALSSMTAFSGSAVSGVIGSPGSLKKTGDYVIGTIQSFAILK